MLLRCSIAIFLALSVPQASAGDLLITARQVGGSNRATVLIRDGKIVQVGPSIKADGATTVDCGDEYLTPGLIDACCVLATESEATPTQPRRRRAPESAGPHSLWKELANGHTHEPDTPTCLPNEYDPPDDAGHGDGCLCGGLHTREEFLAQADLASSISLRATWAEHAAEVVPHRRVLDSVDLLSPDFRRLVQSGVTTIFASPDSGSVIGSRGAVLKTAGPLERRVLRDAADVKASMGADPSLRGRPNIGPYGGISDIYTRRPTTRMGVEWVFRKAFYTARDATDAPPRGADAPPVESLDALRAILAGEIPLRIQARYQHDIYTAARLADEFGLRFTLEEGTEAYKALDLLKRENIPVIYGPIFITPTGFRAPTGEADEARLSTPRLLHEYGIRFALTAQEMRDEEGLARQAMMAAAFGLPREAALQAVTRTPAELLGLENRIGSLKPGVDADLVAWSGPPLAATSRVTRVWIAGELVYEAR